MRPMTQAVVESLLPWISQRLGASDLQVVAVKGAGAGSSADTVIATVSGTIDGARREQGLVIRRQNLGSDLFLDSDLKLPCLAMSAVAAKVSADEIPVPRVLGMETDHTLLGAPFMVMELLPGRMIQQSPNYNREGWLAELPLEQRGKVWNNALEMLARIHRVDASTGFEFLNQPHRGKPGLDQYLHWVDEWYTWARAGRPHRVTDVAINYLKTNRPPDPAVGLLWGDPQSSNFLFGPDGKITGVIDWEMATLGPPEADLAWWLFFDDLFSTGMGVPRLEGLPDRATCIKVYENALGRPVRNLEYYSILAAFRMAIVGMRSVDRQIQRGFVPATTTARENAPIVRLLAGLIGEPLPEVGKDFMDFMGTLGMTESLSDDNRASKK
jgi:aminoglycoside phosphotransferase (APT) family kinase protein